MQSTSLDKTSRLFTPSVNIIFTNISYVSFFFTMLCDEVVASYHDPHDEQIRNMNHMWEFVAIGRHSMNIIYESVVSCVISRSGITCVRYTRHWYKQSALTLRILIKQEMSKWNALHNKCNFKKMLYVYLNHWQNNYMLCV